MAKPTLLAICTAVNGSGRTNNRNGEKKPKNAKLKSAMRSYARVPMAAAAASEYLDFEILPKPLPISAAAPVPST